MFFKRKKRNLDVLSKMDGREVKYITRRISDENGSVSEQILGKKGRIVVIDDEIKVICEGEDVFRCSVDDSQYFTLMSGNGITVSGVNRLTGEQMDVIVYYTY